MGIVGASADPSQYPTLAIRNISWIYPSSNGGDVIRGGYVVAAGAELIGVGPEPCPWETAETTLDGEGLIALPGLINCHHHFFQHLLRAQPEAQNSALREWLLALYPTWVEIDRDAYRLAAEAAIAELLLSGATTSVDMAYLFPDGLDFIEEEVGAARSLGLRLHAIRGSMTVLEEDIAHSLPRAVISRLVQSRAEVITACERAVASFDDASRYSMTRIGVGPTSIDFDDPKFMRSLSEIGTQAGGLHTHMRPRADEVAKSRHLYSMSPIEYLDSVGWLTETTTIAHAANCTTDDLAEIARNGAGIAHCPRMLSRLGAPVPPVTQAFRAGSSIGIGVDGGASNDSGSLLSEMRFALALHRVKGVHPDLGPSTWPTPLEVLQWATSGGAEVLGRDDIGVLREGCAADIALYDTRSIGMAGALRDPLGGILFAGEGLRAHTTVANGRVVVKDGRLLTGNEQQLVEDLRVAGARVIERRDAA